MGPSVRVAAVQAVSRLQSSLGRVLADHEALNAPAALVGGLAVSSRTEPRFTRDVDLAVAVRQDADAEALVFSLQGRGYRVLASVEQDAARRLATVRLPLPPGEPEQGVIIDLLFASSGIEPEVVAHADGLEVWPGFLARVATVSDLLALKILARDDARRPLDHADIRALIRRASPDDLAKAREALALISQRGFDRGKNLSSELTSVLTREKEKRARTGLNPGVNAHAPRAARASMYSRRDSARVLADAACSGKSFFGWLGRSRTRRADKSFFRSRGYPPRDLASLDLEASSAVCGMKSALVPRRLLSEPSTVTSLDGMGVLPLMLVLATPLHCPRGAERWAARARTLRTEMRYASGSVVTVENRSRFLPGDAADGRGRFHGGRE